ncbi:MAG: hypothetical protein PWR24_1214 [Desulfonauticus sp.]|jgi:membrane associated rhomboid family serine protease|nr:hypothetical protein [Desulfonauticus sp.]
MDREDNWQELFPWQDTRKDQEKLLVLEALGFNWQIKTTTHGLSVFIAKEQFPLAQRELLEYEQECQRKASLAQHSYFLSSPSTSLIWSNIALLGLLLISFTLQQHLPSFTALGMLDGEKVFKGEGYRLFSSLFLHKDPAHLLGNIFFSFYPLYLLSQYYGTGFTWLIILGLGTLANGLNLFFLGSPHKSLGFSTASFVSLGLLFATLRGNKQAIPGLALGLGLGFWALFSGGKNTDLGAHFWGLMVGLLAGQFSGLLQKIGKGKQVQLLSWLGILLLFCGCYLVYLKK